MFDQLYKSSQTITRHEAAPYAQERSRYLAYCRQRGDATSTLLTKASDLVWIARKLSIFPDLHVTIEQARTAVVDSGNETGGCHHNLHSPGTRKRLIDTTRCWLRLRLHIVMFLRAPQ